MKKTYKIQNSKTLIEKWEKSGFLEGINDEMKLIYSTNLEFAQVFLEQRNKNDMINALVYPLVFQITKINKTLNIILIIKKFIQYFENKVFDKYHADMELYIIDDFINTNIKYLSN